MRNEAIIQPDLAATGPGMMRGGKRSGWAHRDTSRCRIRMAGSLVNSLKLGIAPYPLSKPSLAVPAECSTGRCHLDQGWLNDSHYVAERSNMMFKSKFYHGYLHGTISTKRSKSWFANPNEEAGRYIYQRC
jgi:hypothetical protein